MRGKNKIKGSVLLGALFWDPSHWPKITPKAVKLFGVGEAKNKTKKVREASDEQRGQGHGEWENNVINRHIART